MSGDYHETNVKNTNKAKSCIDSVPKVSDILMTVVVVCFDCLFCFDCFFPFVCCVDSYIWNLDRNLASINMF